MCGPSLYFAILSAPWLINWPKFTHFMDTGVKMGLLGLANPSTQGEILYLGCVPRESLTMGNYTDVFRLSRFALNLFLQEMFLTTMNVYNVYTCITKKKKNVYTC
jgi:hypothetical protein